MTIKNCEYTYFYIHDHLGSTSMVLDVDGNISQSVTYIPYGEIFVEERNGTWNTPYLFNGKELDEETGLYYYGARYLNPTNGMWLSTDPLFEDYKGVSPYAYCLGNPVKHVDVEGEWIMNAIGFAVAASIDYGAQVAANLATNGFSSKAFYDDVSFGSVAMSALDGAINPIGGVVKAGAKTVAKTATKLTVGSIVKEATKEAGKSLGASVIDQSISEKSIDLEKAGIEVVKGGVLGTVNRLGKGAYKRGLEEMSGGVRLGEKVIYDKVKSTKGNPVYKKVSTGNTTIGKGKEWGVSFDDTYLGDKMMDMQVEGSNMYIKKVIENEY